MAIASSSTFLRGLADAERQDDPLAIWGVKAFVFLLLVSVCSWLSCCGGFKRLTQVQETDLRYAQRLQQRHAEREARRQMTPEERQAAIIQSLRRNQVRMVRFRVFFVCHGFSGNSNFSVRTQQQIVKQEDLVAETDHQIHRDNDVIVNPETIVEENENNKEDHIVFAIPEEMKGDFSAAQDEGNAAWDATTASNLFGSLVLRSASGEEAGRVPNQCAICLEGYCVEDPVVWSSNPDCSHAFHEDCLVDWLVHSKQDGTPCPCCRQSFTDLASFRKERKIRWSHEHAFNPSVVTLW